MVGIGMPTYDEAVCFCGPAPRVAAPGRYPAAYSMEFGLSSGGSKSARDRLMLFGAIILALYSPLVNGTAKSVSSHERPIAPQIR
jgi:hypothetical protein